MKLISKQELDKMKGGGAGGEGAAGGSQREVVANSIISSSAPSRPLTCMFVCLQELELMIATLKQQVAMKDEELEGSRGKLTQFKKVAEEKIKLDREKYLSHLQSLKDGTADSGGIISCRLSSCYCSHCCSSCSCFLFSYFFPHCFSSGSEFNAAEPVEGSKLEEEEHRERVS